MLSLYLFLISKKKLADIFNHILFTEAKLLDKKQLGLGYRRINIWTYEYTVKNQNVKKSYWHFVNIKEIEAGNTFMLAIDAKDKKKSYFSLTEKDLSK